MKVVSVVMMVGLAAGLISCAQPTKKAEKTSVKTATAKPRPVEKTAPACPFQVEIHSEGLVIKSVALLGNGGKVKSRASVEKPLESEEYSITLEDDGKGRGKSVNIVFLNNETDKADFILFLEPRGNGRKGNLSLVYIDQQGKIHHKWLSAGEQKETLGLALTGREGRLTFEVNTLKKTVEVLKYEGGDQR